MKQKTIERFKKMVKPYKKTILIVTLMALFIDICELVKPYLLEQVMDKYLPEKLYIYNNISITTIAVIYILIVIIGNIVDYINRITTNNMGEKVMYNLRNQLYKYIEKSNVTFHDKTPSGKLYVRVTSDTEDVYALFSEVITTFPKDIIIILGLLTMMIYMSIQLSAINILIIPLLLVVTITISKILKKIFNRSKEYRTVLNTFLAESIYGIKLIKIFNRQKEKQEVEGSKTLKNKLDMLKLELDKAISNADYNLAAKIQNNDIPLLKKQIADLKSKSQDQGRLLDEVVTEDNIAQVVSSWTGIPVSKLSTSESKKVLNLDAELRKRVIGQDDALQKVSDAIVRARAGINDPNRPLGSFLFLGPTGVGKTEVCKALAEQLFDSDQQIIRIDMSEYMEKYSVSRLIGAAPGYVGYEEGGQLTEAVRRKPYAIVLLDEIEKAHPDVFNILLQVLDEGRLTDGKGRTVDFKNTILIMTSNLGSEYLLQGNTKQEQDKVNALLKQTFKPEFLNRIDEIVMFNSLSPDSINAIIEKFLTNLQNTLQSKEITFTYDKSVVDKVKKDAYDPIYGARPIKRYIQKYIETPIAQKIIASQITHKANITVVDDDFVVTGE